MTRIIITEAQTKAIINELFSQKLIQSITDKFKQDNPNLDDNTLKFYIDRFQQIKESPKVQNKDITTYSWEDLKHIVDINQPDDIKIEGDGKELIYNQNNLKIYRTNTKQACIKYGTGYNFCISSRGYDNQYDHYRFGIDGINENTIYFIIDEDRTFEDPYHLIVLMAKKHRFEYQGKKFSEIRYVITNANNTANETKEYIYFSDLEKEIPKLNGLRDLFTFVDPNPKELAWKNLKDKYIHKLSDINQKLLKNNFIFNPNKGTVMFYDFEYIYDDIKIINNYLSNKPSYLYSIDYSDEENFSNIFPDQNFKQKWINFLIDDLAYDFDPSDINQIQITPILPTDKKYLTYIKEVKNTLMEFLHEKNKLNISSKEPNSEA